MCIIVYVCYRFPLFSLARYSTEFPSGLGVINVIYVYHHTSDNICYVKVP